VIVPTLRLKRVLCALDVERSARAPLAHAGLLSREFGVPLDGLYVAAPLVEWGSRVERVRRLIAEHNAHERLDALLAPFSSSLDVQSFVTRGTSSEVIGAHANEHRADLIVLGGARKRMAGPSSKLASILSAHAERGILTVPGDSPACALRRILLLVTPDTVAASPLRWTKTLARRFGARVKVVGVGPASLGFWRGLSLRTRPTERQHDLQSAVQAAEQSLAAAGIATEAPSAPLLASEVELLLQSAGFDLVVLGLPAGTDSTESVLLDRLRKEGGVPVLSIRARASLVTASSRRIDEDWKLGASA